MKFHPRARALSLGFGLVLVSGGLWQGRALYEFAICTSSVALAGPGKAMAATATPAPDGHFHAAEPLSVRLSLIGQW